MKILITGGAGYIGSQLVGRFVEENDVYVVDNLSYGPDSLLRYASEPGFNFEKIDVRNHTEVKKVMDKCDVIIPLAALVGFPLCNKDPVGALEINQKAVEWIADNKSKDQIVIYPCTNSGYGTTKDGGVCTEESPLNPVSLYGKTKVAAETKLRDTDGCTTLRLATVYGPSSRMRTDLLVNSFVLKALKERVLVLYECEFMRNYIHIEDVCTAFEHVIENPDSCLNETFNVGNDSINMNKLQLAQKIKEYVPLEIIQAEFTKDPDVRDYIVSSQKIYDTGFRCGYDLDDGIKDLLRTYKLLDVVFYANY